MVFHRAQAANGADDDSGLRRPRRAGLELLHVHAVRDDLDAISRKADMLDHQPPRCLGDGEDARGGSGDQARGDPPPEGHCPGGVKPMEADDQGNLVPQQQSGKRDVGPRRPVPGMDDRWADPPEEPPEPPGQQKLVRLGVHAVDLGRGEDLIADFGFTLQTHNGVLYVAAAEPSHDAAKRHLDAPRAQSGHHVEHMDAFCDSVNHRFLR